MTEKPQRIQLRRTKGWKMPPNTVKVDRSTRWGNPFPVVHDALRGASVVAFQQWVNGGDIGINLPLASPSKEEIRQHLRGKNLACWCPIGAPCHADILLQIANSDD